MRFLSLYHLLAPKSRLARFGPQPGLVVGEGVTKQGTECMLCSETIVRQG